jgi:general secretion pathway protein D
MRWLAALVSLLVPLTAAADAVDESIYNCKPRSALVEITFKPEIELKELLSWAVGFTCKKFVYDPRIVSTNRKVTLIAPGKQSPAQAYDMFTTALGTMGFSAVPKGSLLEIVEASSVKTKTPKIYRDKLPDSSEEVVRYILRPQYAQPETLRMAFTSFKSDAGDVVAIGSLLVITDHASNVRDMASIAKLVDVPGGTDGIYAIPVKHADAGKLVEKLNVLLDISAAAPTARAPAARADVPAVRDVSSVPSKLLVDDRTNTLIVSGTEAAFQRVKALVETLDIALDIEGGATMHVYQLGSAIAEELAKTINDAIQAQTQAGQGDAKRPGTAAPSADLGPLQGHVRVIAEPKTNKLLVLSSGRDFLAIREVIRELDVARRQVYIEAMIMEVQLGNGLSFGTASHGGYQSGDSLLVGGVQMPNLKSYPSSESGTYDSLGAASGLITGILGKALDTQLFGITIPSYAILFQAFADNTRTNILSTMPLLVVDNEQAKYKLGTNVPYIKGVMPTSPISSSQLTTNIDRKDLLLELEIKPHISTDDTVLLEVKQASEDLVSRRRHPGAWPPLQVHDEVAQEDEPARDAHAVHHQRQPRPRSDPLAQATRARRIQRLGSLARRSTLRAPHRLHAQARRRRGNQSHRAIDRGRRRRARGAAPARLRETGTRRAGSGAAVAASRAARPAGNRLVDRPSTSEDTSHNQSVGRRAKQRQWHTRC